MDQQFSLADEVHALPTSPSFEASPNGHHCLALDVVNVLQTRTTMDEVAQYLVLQALSDAHPWQASIYEVGPDSLLRLAGSFGLVDWRGDLHEHSCLDDPHIGDSLRGSILQPSPAPPPASPDGDHPLEDQPVDGHQVIWPLTTPTRLSGVLQVRFHEEPDVHEIAEKLAELTPPIALVLDLAGPHGSRRRTGGHNGAGPSARSDGELTARQREVLRHMAAGMTNGQIARILKFSESTVRQETMAIYRTLQVRGRAEAVQYAEDHGLLERAAAV